MDIVCDKCKSKFRIPDDKIPSGQAATLACPKCKSKISVSPPKPSKEKAPKKSKSKKPRSNSAASSYDASEKPFDFVEEEGKTALICENDSGTRKKIVDTLKFLEYHITEAESAREALKKMRYHVYNLVIINESFDTNNPDINGILIYLERLNMDIRRNIFVAMISDRFRTGDNMMAFRYSVNIIINNKNIDEFGQILNSGIADNEFFYRIFLESLKTTGRL